MCRGLALGWSVHTGVICKGLWGHCETLGEFEDYCIKFELIVDNSKEDGYSLEVDPEYRNDPYVRDAFPQYFTEDNKLKEEVYTGVYAWVKDNETQVLRWLLQNYRYARSNKLQDLRACSAIGRQIFTRCKAGGSQDFCWCEAGGNQDFKGCKAEEQDLRYLQARKQYIAYIKNDDQQATAFLRELSLENACLTLAMLTRMAMECPRDKISEIMSMRGIIYKPS